MPQKNNKTAGDKALLCQLLSYTMLPDRASETAGRLILRFGSVSAVLDAAADGTIPELDGEDGLDLIMLVRELFERYVEQKTKSDGECYDNIDKIGRYLVGRYATAECERVLLLLLDNSYRLIGEECVCDGSVNSARLSGERLCELARKHNASYAVLSHNHPRGIALPSADDVRTTEALAALFESAGIPLLEHILVAGDEYTPIMYTKLGKKRTMTAYGEV